MTTYRAVLEPVLSPAALAVLDRLTPVICALYQLEMLLDTAVPAEDHARLRDRLVSRLERIVAILPADVSPTANEIFTAVEVLVMDVLGRELRIGEEIARLETLTEVFRSDPYLYQLVCGQAN